MLYMVAVDCAEPTLPPKPLFMYCGVSPSIDNSVHLLGGWTLGRTGVCRVESTARKWQRGVVASGSQCAREHEPAEHLELVIYPRACVPAVFRT